MYGSNNTPFMDDVERLYDNFEAVAGYDDLSEREKESVREIRNNLDFLYESTKSREELSKIRWDRIEENAHEMVGEIQNAVGLPDDFDTDAVSVSEYNDMVTTIQYQVDCIMDSLQVIEEHAGELDEISN